MKNDVGQEPDTSLPTIAASVSAGLMLTFPTSHRQGQGSEVPPGAAAEALCLSSSSRNVPMARFSTPKSSESLGCYLGA